MFRIAPKLTGKSIIYPNSTMAKLSQIKARKKRDCIKNTKAYAKVIFLYFFDIVWFE